MPRGLGELLYRIVLGLSQKGDFMERATGEGGFVDFDPLPIQLASVIGNSARRHSGKPLVPNGKGKKAGAIPQHRFWKRRNHRWRLSLPEVDAFQIHAMVKGVFPDFADGLRQLNIVVWPYAFGEAIIGDGGHRRVEDLFPYREGNGIRGGRDAPFEPDFIGSFFVEGV